VSAKGLFPLDFVILLRKPVVEEALPACTVPNLRPPEAQRMETVARLSPIESAEQHAHEYQVHGQPYPHEAPRDPLGLDDPQSAEGAHDDHSD
jgi:hypothetical protein